MCGKTVTETLYQLGSALRLSAQGWQSCAIDRAKPVCCGRGFGLRYQITDDANVTVQMVFISDTR